MWYPHAAYDTSLPADVFISWRYHIGMALGQGSRRRFLWLHDVPAFPFPRSFATHVDGIFCVSAFHKSLVSHPLQDFVRVLPNGIDERFVSDGENDPFIFAYGSAPNRGLETVLLAWPRIYKRLPGAKLEVYYGFSTGFEKWARWQYGEAPYAEWRARMDALLAQDGVVYVGMVDHPTLARAYAGAGFVLYPSAFSETGCVTLMKAMANGAIPITSRFSRSVLPELTAGYDMG
ncbi:unnamed protein product, partial [Phaeothamnion confervicola]